VSIARTQKAQDAAADAVRKFLLAETCAVTAYQAIVAFEEEDGIVNDHYSDLFLAATDFDPDAVLDNDYDTEFDVDLLMELAAEIDDHVIEPRDPFDTIEEARGER